MAERCSLCHSIAHESFSCPLLDARAADPVIPYPPEKSEERLKAFRVIDDPCDPEHLERLAQIMTPEQRQAFYEHLHDKHGCRIYR